MVMPIPRLIVFLVAIVYCNNASSTFKHVSDRSNNVKGHQDSSQDQKFSSFKNQMKLIKDSLGIKDKIPNYGKAKHSSAINNPTSHGKISGSSMNMAQNARSQKSEQLLRRKPGQSTNVIGKINGQSRTNSQKNFGYASKSNNMQAIHGQREMDEDIVDPDTLENQQVDYKPIATDANSIPSTQNGKDIDSAYEQEMIQTSIINAKSTDNKKNSPEIDQNEQTKNIFGSSESSESLGMPKQNNVYDQNTMDLEFNQTSEPQKDIISNPDNGNQTSQVITSNVKISEEHLSDNEDETQFDAPLPNSDTSFEPIEEMQIEKPILDEDMPIMPGDNSTNMDETYVSSDSNNETDYKNVTVEDVILDESKSNGTEEKENKVEEDGGDEIDEDLELVAGFHDCNCKFFPNLFSDFVGAFSGGCIIDESEPCPKGYKCHCSMPFFFTCRGTPIECKPDDDVNCVGGSNAESCDPFGNCAGYHKKKEFLKANNDTLF